MKRDSAIKVVNLGKKYQLGTGNRPEGLRHLIQDVITAPFRLARKGSTRNSSAPVSANGDGIDNQEFWSLRDVSFEVGRGEVVGVIGRNGAGKSTLLKVLSRITEPTTGRIEINGRVSSLLEVGTGFHPELTGRENIYLNGAILGMSRNEIKRKFDQIVEFAEIERFLETPVKRYSSGMYVRLAFAVAAHLDPEILIVDEVLAVGDAEFQRKCLGKMKDVSATGRTVLFVSHSMAAVKQLCEKCIYLSQGKLVDYRDTESVIRNYSQAGASTHYSEVREVVGLYGLKLSGLKFLDVQNNSSALEIIFGKSYKLILSFSSVPQPLTGGVVVEVFSLSGELITSMCSVEEGIGWVKFGDRLNVEFHLDAMRLFPNQYRVSISVYALNERLLHADSVCLFEVESSSLSGATWPYQNIHGASRITNGGCIVFEN